MNTIRLGVIGLGLRGIKHVQSILEGNVPGLTVSAVSDTRESTLEWAKDNLPKNVKIHDDGRKMIDSGSCDAVLIATPHYLHPELSIYALNHGVHVLCEKPAGVYTKHVREACEVAAASGKVYALMLNQRTNCIYRKLHEMTESGELGQLKRVNWIITDWYRTQGYYDAAGWRATWEGEGGGVLLNQCSHQLDLLVWICGMPKKVRAFCHEAKWHDIEVEDDVTAYMEYENGATGVFVTSTGDAPGTNRLELTFEMGRIICEGGKLIFDRLEVNEREYCKTSTEGKMPKVRTVEIETDGSNEQHTGVLKAFADHLLKGTPLVAGGEEGLMGLTLSNAMYLSGWLDRTVEIPFDEDLFLEKLMEKRARSKKKHINAH